MFVALIPACAPACDGVPGDVAWLNRVRITVWVPSGTGQDRNNELRRVLPGCASKSRQLAAAESLQ
ncbi:MAG: hypothetical protein KZQ94_08085 [Candidatus Thiodiazotropha sp. (ex Troendleina suluensis)]|nr:hypothetical protein [Candidatus Thiodiazotropha sp. (ex Troendleina suluensis)]